VAHIFPTFRIDISYRHVIWYIWLWHQSPSANSEWCSFQNKNKYSKILLYRHISSKTDGTDAHEKVPSDTSQILCYLCLEWTHMAIVKWRRSNFLCGTGLMAEIISESTFLGQFFFSFKFTCLRIFQMVNNIDRINFFWSPRYIWLIELALMVRHLWTVPISKYVFIKPESFIAAWNIQQTREILEISQATWSIGVPRTTTTWATNISIYYNGNH